MIVVEFSFMARSQFRRHDYSPQRICRVLQNDAAQLAQEYRLSGLATNMLKRHGYADKASQMPQAKYETALHNVKLSVIQKSI
ncbi:MAG: hypothetical protein IJ083_10190 [Clostridia bacterium]|nr:hypothetical protein [Clostridia bacterium]